METNSDETISIKSRSNDDGNEDQEPMEDPEDDEKDKARDLSALEGKKKKSFFSRIFSLCCLATD